MSNKIGRRLTEVRSLYEILPKGAEGGKEFARIVDLLLFHEARREGRKITIFSDASGDYYGLDSFEGDVFRTEGTVGFQYKFFPSPLSQVHRQEIIKSLKKATLKDKEIKLKKWILVTPQDLTQSATRKDGGDVKWFEDLRSELNIDFELEHWGHKKLLSLFLQTPALCLFYYPELSPEGESRKTIEDIRKRYNDNLTTLYRNIEFVGMSVYKQEATRGVPMEHIYIPLTTIPESANELDNTISRVNPLRFLEPGVKRVILGDPGSGKSTLLRFLALVGTSKALQERCKAKSDQRLPILIILRRYADELKKRQNLSLIDYIQESIQGDFSLKSADLKFFEYYLETGQTILLFDGLDELPNSNYKQIVRDRIRTLITTYPGNTALVTSRIVGYESSLRFDDKEFGHYRLTKLQLSEMERFVKDWYRIRIDNPHERDTNAQDLIRILRSDDHSAIRELAENPLLLTIIALVHRIDAVLPDERVVLYLKCTETLLNTWHAWKYRGAEVKNRGREERRNRRRMEAIANWMHSQSLSSGKNQRAVVPYENLLKFLSTYIRDTESPYDPDNDPEDIANEFIEFVKKKAGLLIEIGDNQYSFVHQTFQEYLTAAHIITSNEIEGVNGIWGSIKEYCNDPRWIEVIRLLIAALQSNASQQILLERILAEACENTEIVRTQLLGGLLLDGVEPAELHGREILEQLLNSVKVAKDDNQLRSLLSMLRTWTAKERTNEQIINETFNKLWGDSTNDKERVSLILAVSALNWTPQSIQELVETGLSKGVAYELLHLFFCPTFNQVNFRIVERRFRTLWEIQSVMSLTSPDTNFIAACFHPLTASLPSSVAAKRFFSEQLVLISSLDGPFADYNFNLLSIICSQQDCDNRFLGHTGGRIEFDSDRLKILSAAMKRSKANHRDISNLRHLRSNIRANLSKNIRALLDDFRFRDIRAVIMQDSDFAVRFKSGLWKKVLSSPELCGYILDSICDTFNLYPRALWREAIRVNTLPSLPQRAKTFLPETHLHLEATLANGDCNEADIYNAAWLLLFDCWLYACKAYLLPEESPFNNLALITRSSDAPPLRIAHCIRDLCFGDASRIDEFNEMVRSTKPEYQDIFAGAFWRTRLGKAPSRKSKF